MELWDAYTRNGAKTGGVLIRGQRMEDWFRKMGYLR